MAFFLKRQLDNFLLYLINFTWQKKKQARKKSSWEKKKCSKLEEGNEHKRANDSKCPIWAQGGLSCVPGLGEALPQMQGIICFPKCLRVSPWKSASWEIFLPFSLTLLPQSLAVVLANQATWCLKPRKFIMLERSDLTSFVISETNYCAKWVIFPRIYPVFTLFGMTKTTQGLNSVQLPFFLWIPTGKIRCLNNIHFPKVILASQQAS